MIEFYVTLIKALGVIWFFMLLSMLVLGLIIDWFDHWFYRTFNIDLELTHSVLPKAGKELMNFCDEKGIDLEKDVLNNPKYTNGKIINTKKVYQDFKNK